MFSFGNLFKSDFPEKFIVEEVSPDKIAKNDKDFIDKRQEELYKYLSSSIEIQTRGKKNIDRSNVPTIESLRKEGGTIFLLRKKTGKSLAGYVFINFPKKKIYNFKHIYVDPHINDDYIREFTSAVEKTFMSRGYSISSESVSKLMRL